jgi:hypothetical protein
MIRCPHCVWNVVSITGPHDGYLSMSILTLSQNSCKVQRFEREVLRAIHGWIDGFDLHTDDVS